LYLISSFRFHGDLFHDSSLAFSPSRTDRSIRRGILLRAGQTGVSLDTAAYGDSKYKKQDDKVIFVQIIYIYDLLEIDIFGPESSSQSWNLLPRKSKEIPFCTEACSYKTTLWDAVPLLKIYGRRAPSGGQRVEECGRENEKKGGEVTENLLDIDPLGNMVRNDIQVIIKKEKLQRIRVEDHAKWTTNIVDEKVDMFAFGVLVLEVITSRRADHTAPSYLNELICHGQFLME
ncbi:LOW QUALITY PROTEIN: hypothetical protein HID58_047222, partial [Brassica napus]